MFHRQGRERDHFCPHRRFRKAVKKPRCLQKDKSGPTALPSNHLLCVCENGQEQTKAPQFELLAICRTTKTYPGLFPPTIYYLKMDKIGPGLFGPTTCCLQKDKSRPGAVRSNYLLSTKREKQTQGSPVQLCAIYKRTNADPGSPGPNCLLSANGRKRSRALRPNC